MAKRRTREEQDLLDFETARSHKGSELAYELCKSTAQACLLMNGGAATAVLAFLSKDKIDAPLFHAVPYCLALYGVGVAASAVMLFCVMMNADYWNYYWYYLAYVGDEKTAKAQEPVADKWHNAFLGCFLLTVGCFLFASFTLAWSFAGVSVNAVTPK